eukprot:GHVO01016008.1.p1 GENE.GHVO01016008.1~~GHVO01016008.1.p1  ORF type:complete len:1276 (+),score=253.79 GHVO01016008.1:335-3829(+)
MSSPPPGIGADCCDVLNDLMRKVPEEVAWEGAPKLVDGLLTILLQPSRSPLITKALICLSTLSSRLPKPMLDSLLVTILGKITSDSPKSAAIDDTILLQAVGSICRSVGRSAGKFIPSVVPLLLRVVESILGSNESTNAKNEVGETCLNAIRTLMVDCPDQIDPYLPSINELLSKSVVYDPNYYGDVDMADTVSNDEEEEDEEDDDDDTSWKLRLASLRIYAAETSSHASQLPYIYETVVPSIICRFRERDPSTRIEVFRCVSVIIDSCVLSVAPVMDVNASTKSFECTVLGHIGHSSVPPTLRDETGLLEKQMGSIMESIIPHLKVSKTVPIHRAISLLLSVVGLLRSASLVFPHHIAPKIPFILPPLLKYLIVSTTPSALRMETLYFIQVQTISLLDDSAFSTTLNGIVRELLPCTNDTFYRISAQSIRTVTGCLFKFRHDAKMAIPVSSEDRAEREGLLLDVCRMVKDHLVVSKMDNDVRETGFMCYGVLCALNPYYPVMGDELLDIFSKSFLDRLKTDTLCLACLSTLKMICDTWGLDFFQSPAMIELLEHISRNTIQKNRVTKLLGLEILQSVVSRHADILSTSQSQGNGNLIVVITNAVLTVMDDGDVTSLSQCLGLLDSLLKSQPNIVKDIIGPKMALLIKLAHGQQPESLLPILEGLWSPPVALSDEVWEETFKSLCASKESDHSSSFLSYALCRISVKCDSRLTCIAVHELLKRVLAKSEPRHLAVQTLGLLGAAIDINDYVSRYQPAAPILQGASNPPIISVFLHTLEATPAGDAVLPFIAAALGCVAAGGANYSFKAIKTEIEAIRGVDARYTVLCALREYINQKLTVDGPSPPMSQVSPPMSQIPQFDTAQVLDVLVSASASEDENERHVAGVCLGQLLGYQYTSTDLYVVIEGLIKDSNPLIVTTAVAAMRNAATRPHALRRGMIRSMRDHVMDLLHHGERPVRKMAWATLAVLATVPDVLEESVRTLMLTCAKEDIQMRKNLIREVDLGPFKHKVDDGIPLRKVVYQTLSASIKASNITLDHVIEYLDIAATGFSDIEDIQTLCCYMMIDISTSKPHIVAQRTDFLKATLTDAVTAAVNREKTKATLKNAAGTVPLTEAAMLCLYNRVIETVEGAVKDTAASSIITPGQEQFLEAMRILKRAIPKQEDNK